MKKQFSICILFLLCILLYACPMNSDYQLYDKQGAIDTTLCGKWRSEKEDNNYMDCNIMKKNKFTYAINWKNSTKGGFEMQYYYAYYSKFNNKPWLVMFSKDTSMHKYILIQLDQSTKKNTMVVNWISDKYSPMAINATELREWILKNWNEPGFFDEIRPTNVYHRIP